MEDGFHVLRAVQDRHALQIQENRQASSTALQDLRDKVQQAHQRVETELEKNFQDDRQMRQVLVRALLAVLLTPFTTKFQDGRQMRQVLVRALFALLLRAPDAARYTYSVLLSLPLRPPDAPGTQFTCFTSTKVQILTKLQKYCLAGPDEAHLDDCEEAD